MLLSSFVIRLVDSRLVIWRQDVGVPGREAPRATVEQTLEFIRQDTRPWTPSELVGVLLIGEGAVVITVSAKVLWRAPRDFYEYTVSEARVVYRKFSSNQNLVSFA